MIRAPEMCNQPNSGVVTGATSGVGFYTAKELARKRATVIMPARDMRKAKEAVVLETAARKSHDRRGINNASVACNAPLHET